MLLLFFLGVKLVVLRIVTPADTGTSKRTISRALSTHEEFLISLDGKSSKKSSLQPTCWDWGAAKLSAPESPFSAHSSVS